MIEIKKNLQNSNKSKGQLATKEDIERIINDAFEEQLIAKCDFSRPN